MEKFMKFITSSATFMSNGKLIMWFYTINMVLLSWYATKNNLKIDSVVGVMYCGALGAYVGSKGFELYQYQKKATITKGMIDQPTEKPGTIKEGEL